MNEMIERLARRIDARLRDVVEPSDLIWTRPGGPSRLAVLIARDAIEAMQEPTEAMELAGVEAERYRSLGLLKVRHVWRAMTSAALAETPNEETAR